MVKHARIKAQSSLGAAIFIGIARHADVERFLAASALLAVGLASGAAAAVLVLVAVRKEGAGQGATLPQG